MKKIYIILLALLPTIMWAQGPTLGHYDYYTNGMNTTYQLCKVAGVNHGTTGNNHTWDFTTLVDSGGTFTSTAWDKTMVTTHYQGTFPGSNFCVRSNSAIVRYSYLAQVMGGTSYLVGTVDSSGLGVYTAFFEPDSMLYSFTPMGMGYSQHDSTSRHYAGFLSQNYCGSGHDTITGDGWGTLMLPHGITYDSTVRIKTVQIFKDTLCPGTTTTAPSITTYAWYDQTHSFCLLKIDSIVNYLGFGALGTYKIVQYSNLGLGVHELYIPTVNADIYPNPNNGNFTLSYDLKSPKAELFVRDVTGRVVYSQQIIGLQGKETINVAGLAQGIYYWELTAANEISAKGKLSVIK